MASKNENRNAKFGLMPHNKAQVMVVPEREMPGKIAIHCAHPIKRASIKVKCTISFLICLRKDADNKINPLTINKHATRYTELKERVYNCSNKITAHNAGKLATIASIASFNLDSL